MRERQPRILSSRATLAYKIGLLGPCVAWLLYLPIVLRMLPPEAKGVSLSTGGSAGIGKGGRKLSYIATVQGNGNLLVGKAYTAMLDLNPGDEFEIKLGKKAIRLIPVGGSEEDESGEE